MNWYFKNFTLWSLLKEQKYKSKNILKLLNAEGRNIDWMFTTCRLVTSWNPDQLLEHQIHLPGCIWYTHPHTRTHGATLDVISKGMINDFEKVMGCASTAWADLLMLRVSVQNKCISFWSVNYNCHICLLCTNNTFKRNSRFLWSASANRLA